MIELISRRTGMADTRTSRKRVAAALMPVLRKADTIDMMGAVQAAIAFAKDFFHKRRIFAWRK
jgi:hypothetical protein